MKKANTIQQLKMCEAFAALGNDVTFVAPGDGDEEPSWDRLAEFYGLSTEFGLHTVPAAPQNYKFTSYPIPDTDDQALSAWLVFKLLSGGFDTGDVVYTRSLLSARSLLQAREWLPGGSAVRIWFEQHQVDRGLTDRPLGDRFYDQVDGVVCISERQKEQMVSQLGVDPSKLFVAHDAVDLSAYEGLSQTTARERLGLDPTARIVMYTGHVYESKGVETLVRAAADIDAECYIVGGYDHDIGRIQSEEDVPENVTFTGFVPPNDIPLYQSAADVLVATVAEDTDSDYFSPLKLFEYMAAEKPMVVARKPEFEEVLSDGGNALFVEPESVSGLASTVQRLLSDAELRTRLGRQAGASAAQHSWEERARRIMDEINTETPSVSVPATNR